MMSPKTRRNIIITVSVALLLIFLWLLSFLIPKANPKTETPTPQTTDTPTSVQTPFSDQQLQQEKTVRAQASDVITTAKLFAERYGSYSNEANFANIRDVLPVMSANFAKATEADLATKQSPKGFYGITTRVITVTVVSQDDAKGTSVIKLSTQRVEENGSPQNTSVKYQDLELALIKESGVWVVDSAKWQ